MRFRYWEHKLQNFRSYWKLYTVGKSLKFKFSAKLFALGRIQDIARENIRHLRYIASVVWQGIFLAFIFLLTTNFFTEYLKDAGTLEVHGIDLRPGEIIELDRSQDLIEHFFVIAQIAGVFLGLYFTALTVVVGTTYANLRNGMRELI